MRKTGKKQTDAQCAIESIFIINRWTKAKNETENNIFIISFMHIRIFLAERFLLFCAQLYPSEKKKWYLFNILYANCLQLHSCGVCLLVLVPVRFLLTNFDWKNISFSSVFFSYENICVHNIYTHLSTKLQTFCSSNQT